MHSLEIPSLRRAGNTVWQDPTAWAFLGSGVRIAGAIVLVPMIVRLLPASHLGFWYLFQSFAMTNSIFAAGMSNSVVRAAGYLAGGARTLKPFGVDVRPGADKDRTGDVDQKLALEMVGTLKVFFGAVSVLFLTLVGLGMGWFIWSRSAAVEQPLLVRMSWVVFAIGSSAGVFLSFWNSLLMGFNHVRQSEQSWLIAILANYVVSFAGLMLGFGLMGLAAGNVCTGLVVGWNCRRLLRKHLPFLRTGAARFSRGMIASLWPNSWRFLMLNLSDYLFAEAPTLLCAALLGVHQTASFGLSMQLTKVSTQISSVWVKVKLPVMNILRARNNTPQLRRIFLSRTAMANATHIANSIFLLVLGRQILSAIGSNTPLLDTGTFACLLAAGLFGLNRGLFSQVVLSQNIIPFWQSWLATSVIAVGISLAAAPRFGALALIAAPILSQLPYVYWRTILEAFRHMRVGPAATPPGAGRNTVRTATVPNFLVIGAARAGTTSIDAGLRQHPSLFMCPRKEPNYFAMAGRRVEFTGPGDMEHLAGKSVTSMDDYLALFRGAGRSQTAGEVSPMYLCDPLAPGRIHGFNPEMRLIAVLRDPVMRAFSGHMMMVRDGRETLSFEDALAAGPGRVAAGWEMLWDHDAISRYSAQVERYLALFPRSQIKFCLYRNYRLDPASFWREVFDFLDVDNTVKITNVELNESFLPRSRVLNRWIHEEMPLKSFARRLLPPRFGKSARAALIRLNRERPAMSKETRRKLIERHRDDILRLQDLLQMDLGLWLQI